MLKKVLSILLLIILVTSSLGSVSATHYTYKVNTTQYETFNLDDWMDDNDISTFNDRRFANALQASDFFITFTEPNKLFFPEYYVTSIKPGEGKLTVEYPWPWDDDYIDFEIQPRVRGI
jgi:hypothetical protein